MHGLDEGAHKTVKTPQGWDLHAVFAYSRRGAIPVFDDIVVVVCGAVVNLNLDGVASVVDLIGGHYE